MPETLRLDQRSTAEWAAVCSLCELCDEAMAQVKDIGTPLIVELRINGVETSFVTIINRLKEEAVRWSNEKAADILMERAEVLQDKLRTLQRIADEVESDLKIEIRKAFPEVHFPED